MWGCVEVQTLPTHCAIDLSIYWNDQLRMASAPARIGNQADAVTGRSKCANSQVILETPTEKTLGSKERTSPA